MENTPMAQQRRADAFLVYIVLNIVASLGTGVVWTVSMVYQIEVVKMTPFELILVGTMMEVVAFFGQIPTGVLADLYSRRLAVVIGYLLMSLSYLLQALFPSFSIMLLSQIPLSTGMVFVSGAEEAWISSEIGKECVGQVFLRATQWGGAGSLMAVPLSLFLANRFQLSTAILVGAIILLALSLGLAFWMPENHFSPTPREDRSSWQMFGQQMCAGGRAVLANSMLLCMMGITLFWGLASEGFDRLNTDHFLQDFTLPHFWGMSPVTVIGLIGVTSTLLTLAATELVKRTVDTSQPQVVLHTLLGMQIVLMGEIVLFGLAGNFALALLGFLGATMVRSVRIPLFNTWMIHITDPGQRATIFSFNGMADPIGQTVGGPIVGVVSVRLSLRAAMVAVSLIMSPALFFLMRAFGLSKRFNETQTRQAPSPALRD
jgi:MFS transporter, DHA3 family, tetracycline resistance protein